MRRVLGGLDRPHAQMILDAIAADAGWPDAASCLQPPESHTNNQPERSEFESAQAMTALLVALGINAETINTGGNCCFPRTVGATDHHGARFRQTSPTADDHLLPVTHPTSTSNLNPIHTSPVTSNFKMKRPQCCWATLDCQCLATRVLSVAGAQRARPPTQ